jgi:ZIP family zinc transporter
MSAANTALLGAIAGLTIFLGLPLGRMRAPAPRTRALLNAGAVGVLLFLLWDILAHAWEPLDAALGEGSYGRAVGYGVVLGAGLTAGLAGLVYFDRSIARRRLRATQAATQAVTVGGPPSGADGVSAETALRQQASQLAMLIAIGIGLHNFAEGLAIGNSAAQGEIALAFVLIIGFGLHNATEGFGIVAPLAAAEIRPSWRYLTALGLIAGGPTFLGTLIGQRFTSDLVSTAFLALAAGSILYVVIELLAVGRRLAAKELTTWGLLAGLLLGFLTDAVLTASGA